MLVEIEVNKKQIELDLIFSSIGTSDIDYVVELAVFVVGFSAGEKFEIVSDNSRARRAINDSKLTFETESDLQDIYFRYFYKEFRPYLIEWLQDISNEI